MGEVEREVCPFEGNADSCRALRVPGRRRSERRKGGIVIVANSEREKDDWVVALRVRIAPWQALAQRVTEVLRSEGPHCAIVRDLTRAIYDQGASEQAVTAESIGDAGGTSHVERNAADSVIVEGSESFAPASFLPESWRGCHHRESRRGQGGRCGGDC